jgi:tetratricopeptide (TPR) repeat protein
LRIREQQWGPEHPGVANVLIYLANLYRKQGKFEEAEPLYQRALHINEQQVSSSSNYARAYLHRGYVYLRLKKREHACADFAKYASLQPGDVNAAWMVVYANFGKQHPGVEIAERLEKVAEFDPQSDEACVCRGVALGLRGKPQEGLTELEQALRLDSLNEDAWFWKGMMCAYLGQSAVAIESIEQALLSDFPPLLLTPLFWLEREIPHFYHEYAEPLLKQHELL